MEKPILYANDLLRQDFIETIKNQTWQTTPIIIAFTLERAYFQDFEFNDILFVQTTEGRIFSAEGEIKWRMVGEKLRVVYLGTGVPPQNLKDYTPELDNLRKEEDLTHFVLWGRRYVKDGSKANEWIEQQVPHRFTYPCAKNDSANNRICVRVENWVNNVKETKFSRYHSITEISEEQ